VSKAARTRAALARAHCALQIAAVIVLLWMVSVVIGLIVIARAH